MYVISETATSTWHYHLREVKNGELYLSGGAPPALCGRALGWDTLFPLNAWNYDKRWSWCRACEEIIERRGHTWLLKGDHVSKN